MKPLNKYTEKELKKELRKRRCAEQLKEDRAFICRIIGNLERIKKQLDEEKTIGWIAREALETMDDKIYKEVQ